jgi:hypothetical protein
MMAARGMQLGGGGLGSSGWMRITETILQQNYIFFILDPEGGDDLAHFATQTVR